MVDDSTMQAEIHYFRDHYPIYLYIFETWEKEEKMNAKFSDMLLFPYHMKLRAITGK